MNKLERDNRPDRRAMNANIERLDGRVEAKHPSHPSKTPISTHQGAVKCSGRVLHWYRGIGILLRAGIRTRIHARADPRHAAPQAGITCAKKYFTLEVYKLGLSADLRGRRGGRSLGGSGPSWGPSSRSPPWTRTAGRRRARPPPPARATGWSPTRWSPGRWWAHPSAATRRSH